LRTTMKPLSPCRNSRSAGSRSQHASNTCQQFRTTLATVAEADEQHRQAATQHSASCTAACMDSADIKVQLVWRCLHDSLSAMAAPIHKHCQQHPPPCTLHTAATFCYIPSTCICLQAPSTPNCHSTAA
jgi:hypothetical protein